MTEGSDQKSVGPDVPFPNLCRRSDSIFYAVGPAGKIAHISTVQKGLQCGCTCPECGAPLVAKKGQINVPHFAHAAHSACGGGPETALHLFAKQIVAERLTLLLPDMVAQHGAAQQVLRKAVAYSFDRSAVEQPLHEASSQNRHCLVPDVFLWKGDRRMMVEIHVTHPCEEQKIAKLHEQDIAAIEIDLSALSRDASPDAVEAAVLSSAPRKWIFHRDIEAAQKAMMAEAQQRAALERKKREQATRRLQAEVDDYERAYQSGVAEIEKAGPFSLDAASEIARARLAKYIGMDVVGYGCFSVRPEIWQSVVLGDFLKGFFGAGCRPAQIRDNLQQRGFVRPRFRFIKGGHESALEGRGIGFKSPFGAIEMYLDALNKAGAVSKMGGKYFLSSALNQHLQNLRDADERRRQRTEDIKLRAGIILDKLPVEDRAGFSLPEWFRTRQSAHETSIAAAIAADGDEVRTIMSAFTAIESMIMSRGRIVENTLGLPVEKERERLRELRRLEAEAREAEKLKLAEAERATRLNDLTSAAHRVLPDHDADVWLSKSSLQLNDRTPAAAAQESASGLRDATDALHNELHRRARERQREAEIEAIRRRLIQAAEKEFGAERGQLFCRGTNPRLGNRRPLDYCVDESTLQACLALFPGKQRRR